MKLPYYCNHKHLEVKEHHHRTHKMITDLSMTLISLLLPVCYEVINYKKAAGGSSGYIILLVSLIPLVWGNWTKVCRLLGHTSTRPARNSRLIDASVFSTTSVLCKLYSIGCSRSDLYMYIRIYILIEMRSPRCSSGSSECSEAIYVLHACTTYPARYSSVRV